MLTWFMYYKWPTGPGTDDDERQVPVLGPETFSFKRGDILWFTVDGMLLGCVEVDRVEWLGPMHVEVWYRASKAVTYCASKRLVKDGVRKIPSKQGERWLEELKSPAR